MAATPDSEVEGEEQRASHPTDDMVREQSTLRPAMVVCSSSSPSLMLNSCFVVSDGGYIAGRKQSRMMPSLNLLRVL